MTKLFSSRDTDGPTFDWFFDTTARGRIENAQVLSSLIENLDFSVKRVPGVVPLAILRPPDFISMEEPQGFHAVEETGVRSWDTRHSPETLHDPK